MLFLPPLLTLAEVLILPLIVLLLPQEILLLLLQLLILPQILIALYGGNTTADANAINKTITYSTAAADISATSLLLQVEIIQ